MIWTRKKRRLAVEQQFDLFVQDVQQRAKGATEEIHAALVDELVVAERRVKEALHEIDKGTAAWVAVAFFCALAASSAKSMPASTVPRWGEYVLLFVLPKKARETLPADLAQEFHEVIVPKMGLRLAHIWYWKEVLRVVPWMRVVLIYKLLKAKIGLPI